jgi:LPXTG-site transpeptidase (sortase) family protein
MKQNLKQIFSRLLSIFSVICLLTGLSLLGYYFYTDYADNQETTRRALEAESLLNETLSKLPELKNENGETPKTLPTIQNLDPADPEGTNIASQNNTNNNKISTESLLRGLITIERFGTKVAVYETMDLGVLRYGLGHYPQTGWPNSNRQIFLAGHNNRELRVLKDIKPGDKITFKSSLGVTDYFVKNTKIVDEKEGGVVNPGTLEKDELVLMTCYPFNSLGNEKERFLVYAYPN